MTAGIRAAAGGVASLVVVALCLFIASERPRHSSLAPPPAGPAARPGGVPCIATRPLSERVEFASRNQAARILGRSDAWARQLSAFDRGARMRTLEPTTTLGFLEFASGAALEWRPGEQAYWTRLVGWLSDAAAGLHVSLPHLYMVKTTGAEEFNFAYTRNRSIVLPQDRIDIAGDTRRDFFLLAHELFHLISAEHAAQRDALYSLLGFTRVAGFEYPVELEDRRGSSPSGEWYAHALTVQTESGAADVVPLLQVALPLEEVIQLPTSGPPALFAHLDVVLLPVDTGSGAMLRDGGGNLITYGFGSTDWPARMQRNSSYIMHADELLADNFALLMEWRRSGVVPAAVPGGPGAGFPVTDVRLLEAMEEVVMAPFSPNRC